MTPDICFMEAGEIAARIRRRDLSAREVLEAHLAQIERVNPAVNAIVTLTADRARAQAEMLDRAEVMGPLHGVPVLHKDPDRHRRSPHHLRVAAVSRPYSRCRRHP